MVDCLRNDAIPTDVVVNDDGTVNTGYGCLSASIQRCMLSDYVEYDIQLKHPGGYMWYVTRRYREFRVLHKALQSKYDLPTDLIGALPGKQFFSNLSPVFVQQRSLKLESYLNNLLSYYTLPPPPLADFIDWEKYDIHGISACLARQLVIHGESVLDSERPFMMNVYQLSAVNKRMQSTVSNNPFNKQDEDFGHVVKFISQVKRLIIYGSPKQIYKSNIAINTLQFDLSPFGTLKYLELNNVDLGRMRGFEHAKTTVTHLVVHYSLKNLKNFMLGDLFAAGDGDWVYGENPVPTLPWDLIKVADFSNNFLHTVDQTIALLPNLEILNLSKNFLTHIAPLTSLQRLRVLYLYDNQLYIGEEANSSSVETSEEEVVDLPEGLVLDSSIDTTESGVERHKPINVPFKPLCMRLGEVQVLVLASNKLRSAALVDGISSLQHLDLANNKIESFEELHCLSKLPHLNSLELMGNPICDHPYYRRNVLNILGPRFPLIVLDGQRVTAKECENVRLFQALIKGGAVLQASESNTARLIEPALSSISSSTQITGQQDALNAQTNDSKLEPPSEKDVDLAKYQLMMPSNSNLSSSGNKTDRFIGTPENKNLESPSKPPAIVPYQKAIDSSNECLQTVEKRLAEPPHESNAAAEDSGDESDRFIGTPENKDSESPSKPKLNEPIDQLPVDTQTFRHRNALHPSGSFQVCSDADESGEKRFAVEEGGFKELESLQSLERSCEDQPSGKVSVSNRQEEDEEKSPNHKLTNSTDHLLLVAETTTDADPFHSPTPSQNSLN